MNVLFAITLIDLHLGIECGPKSFGLRSTMTRPEQAGVLAVSGNTQFHEAVDSLHKTLRGVCQIQVAWLLFGSNGLTVLRQNVLHLRSQLA
jgi:hypothetical protein